jgi:hypothetical protein
LARPGSLTELLRVHTLRLVCFINFSFTSALSQATANALKEGTAVTELEFRYCSFSAVEFDVMMANCLSRNTSVTSITVQCYNTALFDALAATLPSDSTLRHLELHRQNDGEPDCLSPVFLALGQNAGLETLTIYMKGSMEESLCTAINDGLRMNETLESLDLYNVPLSDITPIRGAARFPFFTPINLSNPWDFTCDLVLLNHVFRVSYRHCGHARGQRVTGESFHPRLE